MTTQPLEAMSQQPKFEIGEKVKVVRTGGELETDWEIGMYNRDGSIITVAKKKDDAIVVTRNISVSVLEKMQNMKPFFRTGDVVYIRRSSGAIDFEGWTVGGYEELNGELAVRVENSKLNLEKFYPENELKKDQADLTEFKLTGTIYKK